MARPKWASHVIAAALCAVQVVLIGCAPSLETVERTTDQATLAKIAVEADDSGVRFAAVEKLADQTLAKIAVESKRLDV